MSKSSVRQKDIWANLRELSKQPEHHTQGNLTDVEREFVVSVVQRHRNVAHNRIEHELVKIIETLTGERFCDGNECPARQHAIKKLLTAGIRYKGDVSQDLTEAHDAISRAIEIAGGQSDNAKHDTASNG
jgi:hypothetical protein